MAARKKKDEQPVAYRLDRFGHRHEVEQTELEPEPQPALPAE